MHIVLLPYAADHVLFGPYTVCNTKVKSCTFSGFFLQSSDEFVHFLSSFLSDLGEMKMLGFFCFISKRLMQAY